jgi:hypothetical protein
VQLLVDEVGDCPTCATVALEPVYFENVALGFGFGECREVFPDTLSVDAPIDAINDLPGGIREL